MQIKTVNYRRIRNLGNYQSETLEITIDLDENDCSSDVCQIARATVAKELGLEVPEKEVPKSKPPTTDKFATDF